MMLTFKIQYTDTTPLVIMLFDNKQNQITINHNHLQQPGFNFWMNFPSWSKD